MTVKTIKIVSIDVRAISRLSKKLCAASFDKIRIDVTFPMIPKIPIIS